MRATHLRQALAASTQSPVPNARSLPQQLEALRARTDQLRDMTRGGTEVYHAVARLQSAVRGLCMREAEERRLQAEDEAYASRIKACCRRAICRFIFLCARQLPRFARRGVGRCQHVTTVASAEVLKMGAKRRRWMSRRAMLLQGLPLLCSCLARHLCLFCACLYGLERLALLLCCVSLCRARPQHLPPKLPTTLARVRASTDPPLPPPVHMRTLRFHARGTGRDGGGRTRRARSKGERSCRG